MSNVTGNGSKITPGDAPAGITNDTIIANVPKGTLPGNPMYQLKTSESISPPNNPNIVLKDSKTFPSISESEIEKKSDY